MTSGQTLDSIEIKWYKIDDAGEEKEYFNTKLDNLKVVAVSPKRLDIKNPAHEKHRASPHPESGFDHDINHKIVP